MEQKSMISSKKNYLYLDIMCVKSPMWGVNFNLGALNMDYDENSWSAALYPKGKIC